MTTIESNRCYICAKLFCCSDCCTSHIKKKHPSRESKCPLCRTEKLMVKNFANQELLCHVVFHHLPLHCRLCGTTFNNSEDLQSLGICNRRLTLCHHEERQKSLQTPETSLSFNKTPVGQTGARKKEFSIDGDYNDNFNDLTSPPEFSRHTSTPMNVNLAGAKEQFFFKTPKSPNFSLKTPKTGNSQLSKNFCTNERSCCNNKENNSSSSNETNFKDTESSSCSESNYLSFSRSTTALNDRTPLRSILSNKSAGTSETSSYFGRSRKIGAMQKLDEEMGIESVDDMELTNPQGAIESGEFSPITENRDSQQKDSGKKVRFSDQFDIRNDNEPESPNIETGEEEFFEARQSLSEISIATLEKLSASTALIKQENEKNIEREENDGMVTKSPESSMPKRQNDSSVSTSSRVIMMVVVEKNGSVNASDLAPLIDSSLKKLEGMSLTSGGSKNNSPPRNNENSSPTTSVLTVDSYMSVSTVECYTPQESPTIDPPPNPQESTGNTLPGTGGGIFSTMANAMRIAFRNLAGTNSSRNLSREPLAQRENLSTTESSTASSNVLTNLASALVPRPSKRTRDNDEISHQPSTEVVDTLNEVRSPVSKRPRGWYQIRAREPIARMRNNNSVNSTRGVSSEKQRFQQGSLSVGDTILPIPSRAHQYTQTD